MINSPNTVKAKTFWVWSEKAAQKNPSHSKAGEPIWYHRMYEAPAKWLEDGLIIDSSEFKKTGQADLFEYL